jgi:hypothetical protein
MALGSGMRSGDGQGRWIFAISLAHWARRRIALASPGPCHFNPHNQTVIGKQTY